MFRREFRDRGEGEGEGEEEGVLVVADDRLCPLLLRR